MDKFKSFESSQYSCQTSNEKLKKKSSEESSEPPSQTPAFEATAVTKKAMISKNLLAYEEGSESNSYA